MKKQFLILLTLLYLLASFILTGCSNTSQNEEALSASLPKQELVHEYYCDNFLLTVDDKQIDLTTMNSNLSSISELSPITNDHLYILGRVDEHYNSLMIYDFITEEIIFNEQGSTMCWVQDNFDTVRYLKDNVVYDFSGNVIYQPKDSKLISMIEYVVEDFKITVTDSNYEKPEEIWVE